MKTLKKILNLLTADEKTQVFFLFFLILLMATLDTLGIASILPFVAVLSNPNLIETNAILNNFFSNFWILWCYKCKSIFVFTWCDLIFIFNSFYSS